MIFTYILIKTSNYIQKVYINSQLKPVFTKKEIITINKMLELEVMLYKNRLDSCNPY